MDWKGGRETTVLEPDQRHLLLDSLRPPPGHKLDIAAGTSFTLNLQTLMTVPIAFAMFDRQQADGSLTQDAIATLQALRENADRITLFSQAGMTAVPAEYRSLYVYLEDTIYPVVPPNQEAIFHPKVWYLRFRHTNEVDTAYRLLCLSRNLTFDRSWDTVLRLDGKLGDQVRAPELERFASSLIEMARPIRSVPAERGKAIQELGEEFSRVEWQVPQNFDELAFCPMGIAGEPKLHVPKPYENTLIISPFLTSWAINAFTRDPGPERSIVLSRPESFEALGGDATKHLTERLVMTPDASPEEQETSEEDGDDERAPTEESVAESFSGQLRGLHAKLYVLDHANGRSTVYTGSANATWPAFHDNVEFLVQMTGPTEQVGVDAVIGDLDDRMGLRSLVEPFDPANEEAVEPTEEDEAQRELDGVVRRLAALRYTATCCRDCSISDDAWKITLTGETQQDQQLDLKGCSLEIRPITLRDESPSIEICGNGIQAVFTLSEQAVTPYFAFTLSSGPVSSTFLVTAELNNPPPDREANVLRNLLKNPRDFVRLLLLLLGNIDEALADLEREGGEEATGTWLAGPGTESLLEPLVHAFSRDPARLREIERLLSDLEERSNETIEGNVLPDGWWEIWRPIEQALEKESQR